MDPRRHSVDSNWLNELFKRIDKNHSGSITADELQQALTNGAGTTFNSETVRLMICMFDKNNSGGIELNEFTSLWQYIMDWERTFRSYDKDNSGSIDKDELRVALECFGHNFSEEIRDLFVSKFDRSGHGAIRFDDFIQCCVVLQILTNAFKYHDYGMKGVITLRYEEFIRMVLNLNLGKCGLADLTVAKMSKKMDPRRHSVDSNWLNELFKRIDKDHSGSITADELQEALTNGAGTTFNSETVRLMIGMFDKDNSGGIELNEFMSLWQYIMDWERTFRSYDKDNSGSIDKDELRVALTSFGHNFSEEMLDMFVTKFDRSGQGAIRFDDFIQCCVVLQILTNAFKYHDYSMRGVITLRYEEFIRMVLNLNLGKW